MIEINRILVPTDFSEASVSAYTHAEDLAQRFGAKVDLIHIVPMLQYFAESIKKMGVPFDMEQDLYPHVKDEAEHHLKRLMEDYLTDENRGSPYVLIDRKPSQAISNFAGEHGHDLVVMASRGDDGSAVARGSVTEKVIRHSEVPVFTVDNRLKAGGLKRILVPTDRSPISFTCMPLALTLAKAYKAEITLFYVIELYGAYTGKPEDDPRKSDPNDIHSDLLERLVESLEGRAKIEPEGSFKSRVVFKEGSGEAIPVTTVIEESVSAHYKIETYAPGQADLVVMTTHGFSGLAHFFLGSTTEKVVQHLDMPVLTVKPGEKELG